MERIPAAAVPLYQKPQNNGKKLQRVEKVFEFDKNGNCKIYEEAVLDPAVDRLIQERRNGFLQKEGRNNKRVLLVEKVVKYDENGNCKAYEEAVVETAPDGRMYERRKGFEVRKAVWTR